MTQGIYLLNFPKIKEDVYKIGFASSIEIRIRQLEERYGKCIITFIFPTNEMRLAEDILHRIFWKKRYREMGSWYGEELYCLKSKDLSLFHKACKMIEKKTNSGKHNDLYNGLPSPGEQNEGKNIILPRSLK